MTMATKTYILAFMAFILTFANVAQATPLLDQSNEDYKASVFGSLHLQQQITAGLAGLLAELDLFTGTGNATLKIALGTAGSNTLSWLYNSAVALTGADNGWSHIDLSLAGINLAADDTFVIDLTTNGITPYGMSSTSYDFYNPDYSGGDLYQASTGGTPTWTDLTMSEYNKQLLFRTYVDAPEAAPVPEAGTVWLLGCGIVGLLGLRKKILA